jgi:hypothetical protein
LFHSTGLDLCAVKSRESVGATVSAGNEADGLAVLGKIEETHLLRKFFCAKPSRKRYEKCSVCTMAFLFFYLLDKVNVLTSFSLEE